MLTQLTLDTPIVDSGAPPHTHVGHIMGRTPGSVLAMPQSVGGRFALAGDGRVMTGSTPTDFHQSTWHEIVIKETDVRRGIHLYSCIRIDVRPTTVWGIQITPGQFVPGSIPAQKNTALNSGQGKAAGQIVTDEEEQNDLAKAWDEVFKEALDRHGGIFPGENRVPKNYVKERSMIGMYSKQHEDACGFISNVEIVGEGTKRVTHCCFPEDRDEYRSKWPDAIVYGIAILKVVHG